MIPSVEAYENARSRRAVGAVSESPGKGASELEWQARIYSGELGVSWKGEDGEKIEILNFGRWNREPGPDFCGARIRIGPEEVQGDIEIDGEPRDWESHGHSANEAYRNVVLHVFFRKGARRFFTRTSDNREVTQVCLPPLRIVKSGEPLARRPVLDDARAIVLIEAAARFRLKRKHDAMVRTAALRGRADALFESMAGGLGYKHNKIPFLLVAQRVGLDRARSTSGECLLFGLAGFQKAKYFDNGDEAAKSYLAPLWEDWWIRRAAEFRLVLPDDAWKFAAIRPANHPHRRMGALAALARAFPRLLAAVDGKDPTGFGKILRELEHPYWSSHYSLSCETLPKAAALIGSDRSLDLVINAFLPALSFEDGWACTGEVIGPAPSRKVLQSQEWLTGTQSARWHRTARQQQGLLQLAEDFSRECPESVWESFSLNSTQALV